jgi:outer membrane receptor protein involved in Fe transport
VFQPDRLKSYEAGFKADSAGRRYGLDVAAYYIDWQDIHILAYVNGIGITANAPGGATVRGAELSLTARPVPNLALSGAFAYQNAKLSAADVNLGAAAGERLPQVPRFTAAANVDYEFARQGWRPALGATVRYVSDRRASFDNSPSIPQYQLPAYTLVDLRAALTFGPTDLQLSVHNLFNEVAQLSADTSRGPAQLALARPRTFGITATVHF